MLELDGPISLSTAVVHHRCRDHGSHEVRGENSPPLVLGRLQVDPGPAPEATRQKQGSSLSDVVETESTEMRKEEVDT